ncbi:MAG: nucleotide exchange factor GrpE, partial [Planctomycetaceae bacterium]
RWSRCRAEIENVQKRAYREMLELRQFQVLPLVRDLLPVLDNLHRALAAAESSQSVEDLIQGMQMVLQQFQGIIAGHSVTPIEAVGEPFDPNVHEAIQQRPTTEQPANTVLDEIEQGFRMHDRVIRPSKVIVSCQPMESPDADGTTTQDDAGA